MARFLPLIGFLLSPFILLSATLAHALVVSYLDFTAETFTAEYKEDRLDKAASTGVAMGFTVMSLGIVVVTRSLHADPPSHAAPLS